jgi:hypothetical protein
LCSLSFLQMAVCFFFLRSNSLIFYEGSKPNDNSSLYQEFLNYFLHQ